MGAGVNIPLGNLRAIVILIVVAFHSVLPYLASQAPEPFAFDAPPYRWIAFPIVDRERWFGFDLFCAWQDISLMSLMFFLAGLFAPQSLLRKGSRAYLADRWWRIGLLFILAVAFLSPLAYYASYRATAADPSFAAFWQHWCALPMWPTGPQWFLWQLFLFSAIGAALHGLTPSWQPVLGRLVAACNERPLLFVTALTALSAFGYVPLAMAFGPWEWTYLGPLSFQLSRPLHYFVYFFAGFAIGAYGIDRSVLRSDGPVARHWLAWLAAAIASFAAWGGLTSLTLPDWNAAALAYRLAAAAIFPVASATGVLAFVAIALHWMRAADRVLGSLSANAYGIYLVHYVFVLWLQYALLGAGLNAFGKVGLVFAAALALSWVTSGMLRTAVDTLLRRRHPDLPAKAVANQRR
jgi:glucans biosynthesis protein C